MLDSGSRVPRTMKMLQSGTPSATGPYAKTLIRAKTDEGSRADASNSSPQLPATKTVCEAALVSSVITERRRSATKGHRLAAN